MLTQRQEVFLCDESARDGKLCEDSNLGQFILSANATTSSNALIRTEAIHLKEPGAINYPIKRTGYYCVSTAGYSAGDYTGVVEFRNAFGELPAAQIAKLPFYAAITLVYAFLALGWGVLYWMNRSDILAVQNYITAILCFLVVEMFVTWLFYDFQNRHGLNAGAKALLIVVSVLSAARNSFSFFLLLIVCMGYGVVKTTLGRTMHFARALAITHFVFGIIYAVAFLATTPEDTGPIVLFVVLPLAGTLTAFYIWTLNSLNYTMKDLVERKQHVKAGMYRKLWWCILASIVVIFVFFFVNSWTFAGQTGSAADFVPKHWQTRWFILDGWLNLVYFADVAFIAYVWRPTVNNRRFAMSDEVRYLLQTMVYEQSLTVPGSDRSRRRRLRDCLPPLLNGHRRCRSRRRQRKSAASIRPGASLRCGCGLITHREPHARQLSAAGSATHETEHTNAGKGESGRRDDLRAGR
jgi:hypothetical protein